MDRETVAAFREAAARFAEGTVRPMVGTEGRDGDLGRVAAVFEAALEAGLAASPDPEAPGYDYGVWGSASRGEGAAGSVAVLEALAAECAGVAAAIHAVGLGCLALPAPRAIRPAAAFLPADGRGAGFPALGPEVRAWRPVLLPPGCDAVVLYTGGTEKRLVPLDDPALEVADLAPRTGLAAVRIVELSAAGPSPGEALPPGPPEPVATAWLVGLAAIAAGTAAGALRTALAHARERVQGGRPIAGHPAVGLLLGDAASRVEAAHAHLEALGGTAPDVDAAMAARLRIVEAAFEATTDALQVLGGYGYMEDYRVEKRLRDLMTLRSLAPAPDALRLGLAARAAR